MKLSDQKVKEILIKENYLSADDLKNAEEAISGSGLKLLDYLFTEGLLTKDLLGQALAESYSVPFVDLKKEKVDSEVFNSIPEVVARARAVIALSKTDRGVKVAMADPGDLEIIHSLEKRFGSQVLPFFVLESDLGDAYSRYEADLRDEFEGVLKKLDNPELEPEEKDEISSQIVDLLLKYGNQNKASDIHIEPYEKKIVVRFRIDGIMHDVLDIPKNLADIIITRIKILSKMRTDEHRAAQDGKLRFKYEDEIIDVRVSVLPVVKGENAVLRLLSSKGRQFTLTDLGLSEPDFVKVKNAISKPHGMILVTGPTGSGKSTTLYAVLKILNTRDVNIATIEDPVEYDIEGVSQIQVNTKTNLTFAKGLRSILRQDPNIIMVGEIRDEETAGISVNAALTGHLVLSTLHTNDAATSLPRLLDMGVKPFLVASTVNVVIAQRLVRKLCEKCRYSYQITPEEVALIEGDQELKSIFTSKGQSDLAKLRLYKSRGCKVCNDTGFKGRLGIFEVLEMVEEIKDLILKHASSDEIAGFAKQKGMSTIFEDGIDKVLNGVTTLDEVLRVSKM
jgi:type IV pilus assembly protein PilB